MNTIRGLKPKRFILGTYVNQSNRTTWDQPDPKKVEYFVQDQYENNYIRKVGNRYTNIYEIFDFSKAEKTELLAFNGTTQNYYQCFDTDIDGVTAYKTVYCDVYFMPYKYYPKPYILVILTDRDITDEPNNSYIASNRDDDAGYVLFDNNDDFVQVDTSLTTLGNKKTIAITYNRNGNAWGNEEFLDNRTGSSDTENIFVTGSKLYYRTRILGTDYEAISTALSAVDSDWHTIIITVDNTASLGSRCIIYLDNINITASDTVGGTAFSGVNGYKIGYAVTPYYLNCSIRQYIIFSDIITSDEKGYYISGAYSSLSTAKILWYKCDERSGNLLDSSGNGYTGVPTNVDPTTFYNQAYIWNIDNSVSIGIPNPRFWYNDGITTHDYLFDSLDQMPTREIFYKIENKVDWEDVSITGRLHRRYVYDSSGNIVQDIEFKIEKHNLDRDEYDLLKKFDGADGMEIYPIGADSDYYLSTCSMTFLNYNNTYFCNYAEIKVIPRGQLLS